MELIKQRGKVQYDYLFKFDDYVPGWEQFVGIDLKDEIPFISEIKWIKTDKETDFTLQTNFKILTATTYRDFPIGNVMERISQYIEMLRYDDTEYDKYLDKNLKQIDYFTVLKFAEIYRSAYPKLKTKWRDERNVLLYISYYLLFTNNKLEHISSGDVHNDIGRELGISKSNSVQVLNRLKKKGYLENTDTTLSLIPSDKTIKLYLEDLATVTGSQLDVFKDKLIDLFHENEDFYYEHYKDLYWNEHQNESWISKTSTLEQDQKFDDDFYEHIEEVNAEIKDYSLSNICDMTPIWKLNKYVNGINEELFINWTIDSETMDKIRSSKKYYNDHYLLLSEELIDSLLIDLGIEDYEEYIKSKEKHESKTKGYVEEAPF